LLGKKRAKRCFIGNRNRVAMPMIGQSSDKAVTVRPLNGRLACGENVCDPNHICIIKTGAKFFEQVTETRVAMRLMHGHDPARM
jgi:hypothetical protein